jgi:hypothetical protein
MTEQEYRAVIDRITEGPHSNWRLRSNHDFIAKLDSLGLMLHEGRPTPWHNYYVNAPWPYPEGVPTWPKYEVYIIPKGE